jgi:putative ABC transport system permease protein
MPEAGRLFIVLFYFGLTVWLLRRLRVDVTTEALTGAARAILQLLVMGSVLMAVFAVDSRLLDSVVVSGMVLAAAVIASRRTGVDGGFAICLAAVLAAALLVILPMTLLGAFDRVSSFLIPISGMVVGNAMNSTALSVERLEREMEGGRKVIEALLALGLPPAEAVRRAVEGSVRASLIPSMNTMKSMGLVHIPGLMTGMLLTGADPVDAAVMQAVIVYLIFIGAALSSLTATTLLARRRFTSSEALRPLSGSGGA